MPPPLEKRVLPNIQRLCAPVFSGLGWSVTPLSSQKLLGVLL